MSAAVFEEREEHGQAASAAMSAAVHVVLLAVLVFGVSWQSRPPEAVAVELWEPPSTVAEAPAPPPPPQPAPVVAPQPAPPPPAKVDIAEKAPTKPAPKPAPKVEPKPVPPKAPARPRDEEAQKQIREQLLREQASIAAAQEGQRVRDQLQRESAAAVGKAKADWVDKIRAKIRGNLVLPPDLQGNPDAVFLVVQLPTGEVLSTKPVKSSGHRGYDEAVERAILKSSPLPRPDKPDLFERELRLTFRPKD